MLDFGGKEGTKSRESKRRTGKSKGEKEERDERREKKTKGGKIRVMEGGEEVGKRMERS